MPQNPSGEATANPMDRLKSEATDLIGAFGNRAVSSLRDRVEDATDRLTDLADGGAKSGVKAAVSGASSLAQGKTPLRALASAGAATVKEKVSNMFGKGSGGGKGPKVTNIVEAIDVGVPVNLAYDQWTRFTDFPMFMKKVENVEQADDNKVNWKAQIFWSHRTWETTILEQSPDDKIVWRGKGPKGYADGAVTFHELAPNLTRVLVTLAYHPQGLFERTGNIWRAQGRRVRLELKHFRRYVMTEALLHPDDVEGWRGTIKDGTPKGSSSGSSNGAQESEKKRAVSGARPHKTPASQGKRPAVRKASKGAETGSHGSRRDTEASTGGKDAAPVRRRRSEQPRRASANKS